ncbi:unnamed protein product [Effrenium voratum]|nr:unnamed protein product [Effrenium voratum]
MGSFRTTIKWCRRAYTYRVGILLASSGTFGMQVGLVSTMAEPDLQASLLYIFRHGLVITGEKRAVVCMQTFAKTLVQMGHVTYDEAASAEPLKKALQTYNELGIVRWARRIGDQGEKLEVLELEPEYRGTGDEKFRELIQLTNEVASYRRCWREQDEREGPARTPLFFFFQVPAFSGHIKISINVVWCVQSGVLVWVFGVGGLLSPA